MRIHEQLDSYLCHLKATGRKADTIKTYRSTIGTYVSTLVDMGVTCAEDVESSHIVHLAGISGKKKTVHHGIMVLCRFILHCTGHDPLKDVDLMWARVQPTRAFITREDFRRMYAIADREERIVLLLGAMMGLRRGEIAGIKVTDIGEGHILVHGKGHTDDGHLAYQPMPEEVRKEVMEHIAWKERTGSASPYLVDMASVTMSHHIRALGDAVGVHATPHSLRRLYATTLYDNGKGADLLTVKSLMRHAHLETTVTCYIASDPQICREAAERCACLLM